PLSADTGRALSGRHTLHRSFTLATGRLARPHLHFHRPHALVPDLFLDGYHDLPAQTRAAMSLPILYSYRRCPYAMRARMALRYAGIAVEIREIVLRNKPQAMLAVSPKGTVPVLVLPDGEVIDESLEIMGWALA